MSKILDMKLTISRPQNNDSEYVELTVTDEASRIQFLSLKLSLDNMMKALTGQGYIPATGEVRNLSAVGKQKIREDRIITIEQTFPYRNKELRQYIRENHSEPGWELDLYLGSQGSVIQRDNKTIVRYAVYKFVDNQETNAA